MTEPLLSTKPIPPAERLIVALDLPDADQARALVERLDDTVHFYKLGLELFMAGGYFALIDWLRARGSKVFVDLKFFDVPQTVGAAVRRLAERGADLATVHGNDAILEAAVAARGSVKILAVTVLTSLDQGDIEALGFRTDVRTLVVSRARRALALGCNGVVASGLEAPEIRAELGERLLVVVPGIRPVLNKPVDDQKRTVDVEDAFRAGADHIVLGRPIHAAREGRVPGAERALHEDHVKPPAELEADRVERAGAREAERGVQSDGPVVGAVADHRDHLAVALALAGLDQHGEQAPPEAAPDHVRVHVDRILDGVPVGGARAHVGCVGEAGDVPVGLDHQKRQVLGAAGFVAFGHGREVGRHLVERARSVQDVRRIDVAHRRQVIAQGRTHQRRRRLRRQRGGRGLGIVFQRRHAAASTVGSSATRPPMSSLTSCLMRGRVLFGSTRTSSMYSDRLISICSAWTPCRGRP